MSALINYVYNFVFPTTPAASKKLTQEKQSNVSGLPKKDSQEATVKVTSIWQRFSAKIQQSYAHGKHSVIVMKNAVKNHKLVSLAICSSIAIAAFFGFKALK